MKTIARAIIVLVCFSLTTGIAFSQLSSSWIAMNRAGDYSNGEAECYNPANVQVAGGYLVITTQVQTQVCGDQTHNPSSFNYTSGMVQWTSFNFTYGTVEFRAKTAGGRGSWPAVWMLGADCQASNINTADNVGTCNWPNPGSDEIDILEMSTDNYVSVGHDMFVSTGGQDCFQNTTDTSKNWHVYTMTWAPGSVTYAIDGTAASCSHTSHVPSKPLFLIINNAMGGGGGGAITNSDYPQTMQIDYVQVTQNGSVIFYDGFGQLTCDLNGDGVVNNADVQIAINQAINVATCGSSDLDQDGICNAVDVQRVINAALGQPCKIGP